MTTRRTGRTHARQLVLPVTVAAVGLATLGVVQAVPNRHAVQGQLTDRSTRALSAAGITDARVQFAGRDATVHVQSAGDRDRALAIVRSQQGVRVAHVIVDRVGPRAGGTTRKPAPGKPAPGPRKPLPGKPVPGKPLPRKPVPGKPVPGNPSQGKPVPNGSGAGTAGPASPPSASGDVARVQHAVDACGSIRFASASAALTPAGRKAVERVATILRANTSIDVQIQGFTDAVGSAATNLALSRARARTVYDTLRVLGITAARMSSIGYGESHPRVPNDSRAHRATNRRVAFTVRANPTR